MSRDEYHRNYINYLASLSNGTRSARLLGELATPSYFNVYKLLPLHEDDTQNYPSAAEMKKNESGRSATPCCTIPFPLWYQKRLQDAIKGL